MFIDLVLYKFKKFSSFINFEFDGERIEFGIYENIEFCFFVIEINSSFVIKFRFALPLSRQVVPLKLAVSIQRTIVGRLLADQLRKRVAPRSAQEI